MKTFPSHQIIIIVIVYVPKSFDEYNKTIHGILSTNNIITTKTTTTLLFISINLC